ncbi:MAG: hypothetical protein V8R01_01720 [Bacilli bacterium]
MDTEGAVNKFIARSSCLGENEKYKNIMQEIYDGNYGESIKDVADKMAMVRKILVIFQK